MINENGKIAPAPWVPYTRAGCDFGAVATANTVLENTAIDIPTVFGAGLARGGRGRRRHTRAQAFADFVGIGVHCAQDSSLCSTPTRQPDLLPDEPGGYSGYNGLFGAKYVDPVIMPERPDDRPRRRHDPGRRTATSGFPGFDGMVAAVSLSYVARCRSTASRSRTRTSPTPTTATAPPATHFAYGPGEAGYVQQLHDYDAGVRQVLRPPAARRHRQVEHARASIPARASQSFAWNHGDIQDEIASTWIGLVGPGVENNGVDHTTWSDHTDLRPTILDLVGLKDDYTHDGRLLTEDLTGFAIPQTVKKTGSYVKLAQIYKQLNASFGAFDMDTLKASTKALASGSSSDDSTYTSLEGKIESLTTQRDALASQIKTKLDDVAFNGKTLTEQQVKPLIAQAQSLLDQAHALAS